MAHFYTKGKENIAHFTLFSSVFKLKWIFYFKSTVKVTDCD